MSSMSKMGRLDSSRPRFFVSVVLSSATGARLLELGCLAWRLGADGALALPRRPLLMTFPGSISFDPGPKCGGFTFPVFVLRLFAFHIFHLA